ncbi:Cation/H+ exchanger [Coemansia spiralis]|nr:Cation/H+ exchanger [Coemansia spiralis]
MPWIHLNLGPSATVPLLLGTFAVFFGLISMVVKEWLFVSDTLVALLFGILFGPAGLDAVNPADWIDVHSFTLEFTRLIIAIQVMAAGITLPKKYLRDELKSLLVLLGPVMIWMWLTSAVIIMLVFRLSLLESLLIASCVAPTDPVLANSIVRGRFAETKVPQHVRNIISAESGANDGLGYPYLYLALYLLKFTTSSEAITRWFVVVVVWEIVMSIVFGAIIGWAARKLLQFARKKSWVDHDSFLSFAISLTLLTLGTVALVGSDDILACFIAGNAFTWDGWFTEETKQAHFQDVLDTVFNFTFFIYLGAIIPWKKLAEGMEMLTTSRLVAAAVLIILFRRLPMTLAVTRLTPAIKTFREAVFAGWFGPIGVGAVFYAMVAYEELQDEAFDGLAPITPTGLLERCSYSN